MIGSLRPSNLNGVGSFQYYLALSGGGSRGDGGYSVVGKPSYALNSLCRAHK